jgi:hypothetical protein
LKEENDDSENDGISNFENDISQMVSMVNISSNNIIRSNVKKEKKRSFRGSRWKEKDLWSWLTITVKVGLTS